MSREDTPYNGNGNGSLSKNVQIIIGGIVVAAVLGAVAAIGSLSTRVTHLEAQVEDYRQIKDELHASETLNSANIVKINYLEKRIEEATKDVVPRNEHERKWASVDKEIDDSKDRLGKVESFLRNILISKSFALENTPSNFTPK